MARRKFKDSATGQIHEVDVDEAGNETPIVAAASIADGTKVKFEAPQVPYKVPGKQAIMNAPGIPTQEETFGKPPTAMEQLTMGGSLLGGALGGGAPAGAAAIIRSLLMSGSGATLGNLIGQTVASKEEQAANPENFGVGAAFGAGAQDVAVGAGFGAGLKGLSLLPGIAKNVSQYGLRGMFNDMAFGSKAVIPKDYEGRVRDMYDPATRKAINEGLDKGVDFTVGQVTGKSELENLLAKDTKILRTREAGAQNKATVGNLLTGKTGAELGQEGVKNTRAVRKAQGAAESAAQEKVSAIAKTVVGNSAPARIEKVPGMITQMDANGLPVRVPGMIEKSIPATTVEGPISLFQTKDLANDALTTLSSKLELVKGDPVLSSKLNSVINTLSSFKDQAVVGYESIKQARTELGSLLKGTFGSLTNPNETRILTNLRTAITKDMEDSIDKVWGADALKAWKTANRLTQRRAGISTEGMDERVQRSTRTDAVPESFFDGAFNDASTAKLVKRNAGPAVTQQAYVRQFYDRFADNLGGTYRGRQALEEWGKADNQEVAKVLMPKEQREAFEYFLRRAAILEDTPTHVGQLSLAGAEINAALGTAKGAAAIPTKITDLFNMSSGKFIAILSGRQFAEKVLSNAAKAREASRLITTQAGRPGGDSAAWKFITGANMGEILIRNSQGEEVIYDPKTGKAFKTK